MAGKRDDFLLRAIDQLRQMVAQAVKLRDSGQLEQALFAIIHAQEGLFARPAQQFMTLGLDEQIRLLKLGESPETGRGKCIGYALSLKEAGLVYEARDKPDLAQGAFQSALYILLVIAVENPRAAEEIKAPIVGLLERVPVEQRHPPLMDLLKQLEATY